MPWPPPVVMLTTASDACLITGRNSMNTSGSGVGRPSFGSRACRCTIAAPASAAPIAPSRDLLRRDRQVRAHGRRVDRAGHRAGDDHLVGGLARGGRHDVHSPICSAASRFCAASAIRRRSRQTLRSASALGRQDGAPLRRRPGAAARRRSSPAAPCSRSIAWYERAVAAQIVGDAARRVEVDGLERPHERPAQADAVA